MEENTEMNHKYYFALTLRNSATHLPTIIDNLLRVIYIIGENNVFMSIYESGSSDDGHTTAMIDIIRLTMEAIGLEHHIEIEGEVHSNPKNAVLRPLRTMYKSGGRLFNTVVMMGDDLWCAEEFLELLYQSRGQTATIACSTDVRLKVLAPPELTTNSRMMSIQYLRVMMSMVKFSTKYVPLFHDF
jgi:alpha-1,3-mannosyltransferase